MRTSEFSFRRLLLIGLFGVTFPVLVIGVYMTYIKASSEFLKNTQENLTEKADNKADTLQKLVKAFKTNLVSTSESAILKLGSPQEQQQYLENISQELPTTIRCLQLTNVLTKNITATTCENQLTEKINQIKWSSQRNKLSNESKDVKVLLNFHSEFIFVAPIYSLQGQLKYILSVKTDLLSRKINQEDPIQKYWLIFDSQGTVISHPLTEKIGQKIQDLPENELMLTILKSSLNFTKKIEKNELGLVSNENSPVKTIAGYSEINSPVDNLKTKWFVVEVATIHSELGSLEQIHQVLLLTMGILFVLQVILMIYLARTLGRPIDQLKDYALHIENFQSLDELRGKVPGNFSIKEFNQLSEAFDQMLTRLKEWGKELEKAWERTKSANDVKDMFLATISHELRTPLNGIMGSIELVKENFCDTKEEEHEFLDRAHREACRLLDIIDDILDISKIQEGKISVFIEPLNLASIIKDVVENQKMTIQKKGLVLNLPVFQDDLMVYGDEQRITQVLINVIGNAIKFTETGSITLTIEKQKAIDSQANGNTNDSNNVVIKVTDTGIGIDPAQQSKLFRPFVMVDGSTTRKYRGSGLGLAISKFLMEEMEGTISLHSEGKGKGTVVEIALPIFTPSNKPVQTLSR